MRVNSSPSSLIGPFASYHVSAQLPFQEHPQKPGQMFPPGPSKKGFSPGCWGCWLPPSTSCVPPCSAMETGWQGQEKIPAASSQLSRSRMLPCTQGTGSAAPPSPSLAQLHWAFKPLVCQAGRPGSCCRQPFRALFHLQPFCLALKNVSSLETSALKNVLSLLHRSLLSKKLNRA